MALYAFDGTWNEEKSAGEYDRNTNVVRFRDAYDSPNRFFFKGVGTRYGRFGRFFGGAFGVGGKKRIQDASRDLGRSFLDGDEAIDIVGFSRGAALALHFANVVSKKGVRHPESRELLRARPEIRFLGLWDVVASFGVPINLGPIKSQRINLGYKLKLPENVAHCFHALSLDERRQTFRPTRVENGYEVWFRGVHSDVGGGNENLALNNIALRWMMRKAQAAGLPVPAATADELSVDPEAAISQNRDLIRNKPRQVGAGDLIHYAVEDREGREHHNPPSGAPRESDEDEKNRLRLAAV